MPALIGARHLTDTAHVAQRWVEPRKRKRTKSDSHGFLFNHWPTLPQPSLRAEATTEDSLSLGNVATQKTSGRKLAKQNCAGRARR